MVITFSVRHVPALRLWILTATPASHALNPPADTCPLATRWRASLSDTVRAWNSWTMKSVSLTPVPLAVVTPILPSFAPDGTTATIWVADWTVKVADTPSKVTAVAPVKFEPVIVTSVPTRPFAGENDVITGTGATVKSSVLVALPAELVTVIGPVVAPEGTTALIRVPDTTVKVAPTPLKATEDVPAKFVPVMVTVLPTAPMDGENEEMVGTAVTMKSVALVPVPLPVVTVILPVVAPLGTLVVICVEVSTVKLALVPSNFTVTAPVKSVPVRTTVVPTGPVAGENEVIVGAPTVTVKSVELVAVPFAVVTVILPVEAPAGTVALILVDEVTVKVAETPLNFTDEAPVKPVPLIVTVVPTGPLFGENDEIVGGVGVTVKLLALVAVPPGVVTVMAPVEAPEGTVAVIWVLEFTVKVALVPANLTLDAPVKFVPVIVTDVPTGPLAGENDEIAGTPDGVTSKLDALVPVPSGGLTTEIGPSVAPVGTVAVICVSELITKSAPVPLNSTFWAPVNPVPEMTTEVPIGPLVGLNDEIVGAAARAAGTTTSAATWRARTTTAPRPARRRASVTPCMEKLLSPPDVPAIPSPFGWKVLDINLMQS